MHNLEGDHSMLERGNIFLVTIAYLAQDLHIATLVSSSKIVAPVAIINNIHNNIRSLPS